MTISLGYLLPTRERIMVGSHGTDEILKLGDKAEEVGLDSVWIGDSLLAKPRHEPLTLIAAIAGRTRKIKMGTAVLLPMLRNPVLLAHQIATLDQISHGRFIMGIGTARDVPAIQNEFKAAGVPFEKRIGTMLESMRLCRALWTGGSVNWRGRWDVSDAELAPTPYTKGGPHIWSGGGVEAALKRSARYFDGWFPSGPGGGEEWSKSWSQLKEFALEAGRDPSHIVGAAYVTVSIKDDVSSAEAELNHYLESYYNLPAEQIRNQQYCFAGEMSAATSWVQKFVDGGASHMCLRFTGSDDERQMEALASLRERLT